jgi:hypothetical protein
MKKIKNQTDIRAQKRALKASKRRKAYAQQKHLWDRGIGLYEVYTKEERDKSDKL